MANSFEPPTAGILAQTYRFLRALPGIGEGRISALSLSGYFTIAEIEGGDAAACMSYYRLGSGALDRIQRGLQCALRDDPMLFRTLFDAPVKWDADDVPDREAALLMSALSAAVLGAVSAASLRSGGDSSFEVSSTPPTEVLSGAQNAVVVGFGGYMHALAHVPGLKSLHVADLSYGRRRSLMDAELLRYRQEFPQKRFSVSDGHDLRPHLHEADLVSITGSALCNGTLDSLLEQAEGCKRIVVQGQSAAIHPKCLFDRGVHLVATTLKPRHLSAFCKRDPGGETLRALMEGGLPYIYLRPRTASRHSASPLGPVPRPSA